MVKNIAIGTGRRKTSVARVFVRDGSGKIVVNGKDVKEYFASAEQIQLVNQPLLVTSMGNNSESYIARTSGLKAKDYLGYAMGDAAGCRRIRPG